MTRARVNGSLVWSVAAVLCCMSVVRGGWAATILDTATARTITGSAAQGLKCDHVYDGPQCPVNKECHEFGNTNWGKDELGNAHVCTGYGTTCTYPVAQRGCVIHRSYFGDPFCDLRMPSMDKIEVWHNSCD